MQVLVYIIVMLETLGRPGAGIWNGHNGFVIPDIITAHGDYRLILSIVLERIVVKFIDKLLLVYTY